MRFIQIPIFFDTDDSHFDDLVIFRELHHDTSKGPNEYLLHVFKAGKKKMGLTKDEIQQLADAVVEKVSLMLTPMLAESDHALVDIHGAAEILKCSVQTIERRTKSGHIPSTKIGRLRRYKRSDLLRL